MKGNLFSWHGHQYNYTETVPIGKSNHHYLFMRTIKFSLPKLDHIRWPSYVKGYSFLDGSLLGQRTYLAEKIVFTAWGTTRNICYILNKRNLPKNYERNPFCGQTSIWGSYRDWLLKTVTGGYKRVTVTVCIHSHVITS